MSAASKARAAPDQIDANSTCAAALEHASRRGWPVFPCNPENKKPLTEHGFKDATTDADVIRGWWRRRPDALIGVPTGPASGVDVLDLDVKDGRDGLAAVPDWERRSPVIARTRSGGAHLFFRSEGTIRCTANAIAPGVDTRGDGGYVIVPPSPGYSWVNGSDLSDLPPWPADLRPPEKRARTAAGARTAADARTANDNPPPDWLVERMRPDAGQGLSRDPADLPPAATPERIEAALEVIPSDDYQVWFEVGAAIRRELGEAGFDLFDRWSAGSPKYDARECAAKWGAVASVRGFSAGTIFHHADREDPRWRARFEEAAANRADSASKETAAAAAIPAAGKSARAPSKPSLENLLKSASDLRTRTFDPLKWIVPRFVPEGQTMLVGRPKIGKSWLGLDMAIAVAAGGSCLGETCEQGDVLGLFLEDTDRRLQRRMTTMLGAYKQEWPARLRYATDWPRLTAGGLDLMCRWIGTSERPRLIVVDVLQRVRTAARNQESTYAADYEALAALQSLAGEAQLSVLVLHHQRKAGADDPFDTVSGTLGLTGAADAALILSKDEQGKCLYGRGRDLEEFSVAVCQDERLRWRVLGPSEEVHVSGARAAIIDALKKAGRPMHVREIAEAVGSKYSNVKKLLSDMHYADEVDRVSLGIYALPKSQAEMDLSGDGHTMP